MPSTFALAALNSSSVRMPWSCSLLMSLSWSERDGAAGPAAVPGCLSGAGAGAGAGRRRLLLLQLADARVLVFVGLLLFCLPPRSSLACHVGAAAYGRGAQ